MRLVRIIATFTSVDYKQVHYKTTIVGTRQGSTQDQCESHKKWCCNFNSLSMYYSWYKARSTQDHCESHKKWCCNFNSLSMYYSWYKARECTRSLNPIKNGAATLIVYQCTIVGTRQGSAPDHCESHKKWCCNFNSLSMYYKKNLY